MLLIIFRHLRVNLLILMVRCATFMFYFKFVNMLSILMFIATEWCRIGHFQGKTEFLLFDRLKIEWCSSLSGNSFVRALSLCVLCDPWYLYQVNHSCMPVYLLYTCAVMNAMTRATHFSPLRYILFMQKLIWTLTFVYNFKNTKIWSDWRKMIDNICKLKQTKW